MQDPSIGVEATPRSPSATRATRPLRRSLAVSAGLAVAFIGYTWLVVSWGPFVRLDEVLNRNFHVQALWPVLSWVDRIGQASPLNWSPERAVCLPLLVVIAAVTGRRHRSWRPLALVGLAVVLENVLVLIPKLAMARGRPLSGHSFFSNGDLYPSGHTANIVAYYGLCYYLVTRYGEVSERTGRRLLNIVVALSAIMFATSLLMRWHWFSDLIGGFMIGGLVLALTIVVDSVLPKSLARAPDRQSVPHLAPVDERRRPAIVRNGARVTATYPSSGSAAVEDRASRS